jgi:hypothetical protein
MFPSNRGGGHRKVSIGFDGSTKATARWAYTPFRIARPGVLSGCRDRMQRVHAAKNCYGRRFTLGLNLKRQARRDTAREISYDTHTSTLELLYPCLKTSLTVVTLNPIFP